MASLAELGEIAKARVKHPAVEHALATGWTSHPRKSGHLILRHPSGQGQITVAGTPSDRRATQNALSGVKRINRQHGGG